MKIGILTIGDEITSRIQDTIPAYLQGFRCSPAGRSRPPVRRQSGDVRGALRLHPLYLRRRRRHGGTRADGR